METNRQRLDRLGMSDDLETLFDIADEAICKICNQQCNKNLGPSNPSCEGRWCEEAVDIWLDEACEEEDDGSQDM